MNRDEKERAVRDLYDAWNRHDEEGAVSGLSVNVQLEWVPTGQMLTGRDVTRERFRRWCTAFPDGKMTIEHLFVADGTVIVQIMDEGTQLGPLGPHPASSKPMKTHRVAFLDIDSDGKITRVKHYFDQLSMLQQLGHVAPTEQPQPGGAGPAGSTKTEGESNGAGSRAR